MSSYIRLLKTLQLSVTHYNSHASMTRVSFIISASLNCMTVPSTWVVTFFMGMLPLQRQTLQFAGSPEGQLSLIVQPLPVPTPSFQKRPDVYDNTKNYAIHYSNKLED